VRSKRDELRFRLEWAARLPDDTITDPQLDRIIAQIRQIRRVRVASKEDWVRVALEVTQYKGPMQLRSAIDFSDLNDLMDALDES
jgi:hypothetical protein